MRCSFVDRVNNIVATRNQCDSTAVGVNMMGNYNGDVLRKTTGTLPANRRASTMLKRSFYIMNMEHVG